VRALADEIEAGRLVEIEAALRLFDGNSMAVVIDAPAALQAPINLAAHIRKLLHWGRRSMSAVATYAMSGLMLLLAAAALPSRWSRCCRSIRGDLIARDLGWHPAIGSDIGDAELDIPPLPNRSSLLRPSAAAPSSVSWPGPIGSGRLVSRGEAVTSLPPFHASAHSVGRQAMETAINPHLVRDLDA
jgi:hypothetical protein